MKNSILSLALVMFCFKSYCQVDGLVAANSDNSGSQEKIANEFKSANPSAVNAWIHIKAGMQFDQSSETNKAIKEYGIAISLDDGIAEAFDHRAVCYIKLGKYQKALNDLEDAIDINSTYVEAYNHLGVANYWLKNYQDAINFYTRAIALNPSYGTPYFNRAIVYLVLEENQLALNDLNKAKELKLDGVDPVLQEFFADKK
jgi:tetratricopeptide (TPR) repeat protein